MKINNNNKVHNEIIKLALQLIEQQKIRLSCIEKGNNVENIPTLAFPEDGEYVTKLRQKVLNPLLKKVKALMQKSYVRWLNEQFSCNPNAPSCCN